MTRTTWPFCVTVIWWVATSTVVTWASPIRKWIIRSSAPEASPTWRPRRSLCTATSVPGCQYAAGRQWIRAGPPPGTVGRRVGGNGQPLLHRRPVGGRHRAVEGDDSRHPDADDLAVAGREGGMEHGTRRRRRRGIRWRLVHGLLIDGRLLS